MVIFKTIRYRNFLSTGNYFIEIELDKSPAVLILGKNGSGKSTVLDALFFALFGKPFRNINKPGLVNSINQKDCLVELEFIVGGKEYKIIRGIKPNIFEIYVDGKKIDQDSKTRDYQEQLEKFIIKMNHKSAAQIVVLGSSSFVPFMQLSAADRRNIIEDLLDIQIFSSMNVLLKQKMVSIKEQLGSLKYDMDVVDVKIDSVNKLINEIKNHNQAKVEKNQKEINDSEKNIVNLETNNNLISLHIDQLAKKIVDEAKEKDKIKTLHQLETKIESNIKKIEKELKFFDDNDNCPTCQQEIVQEFKDNKRAIGDLKIIELDKGLTQLKDKIKASNTRLADIQNIAKEIAKHNSELVKNNATITEITKYIKKLKNEISTIEADGTALSKETSKLETLTKEAESLNKKQEALITDRHYYDIASLLLKDTGIKTKIIKQYLPIINKLVNKHLANMDFFVNFLLDENFDEQIKSRFRDDFAYENFSEGEKQKIDLALLFTWRSVAKLKNSVSTNLLILDEVFDSSLDADATEGLMKILNGFGPETNLIVISHKGDILIDKFKDTIRFEKVNNFSRKLT